MYLSLSFTRGCTHAFAAKNGNVAAPICQRERGCSATFVTSGRPWWQRQGWKRQEARVSPSSHKLMAGIALSLPSILVITQHLIDERVESSPE